MACHWPLAYSDLWTQLREDIIPGILEMIDNKVQQKADKSCHCASSHLLRCISGIPVQIREIRGSHTIFQQQNAPGTQVGDFQVVVTK